MNSKYTYLPPAPEPGLPKDQVFDTDNLPVEPTDLNHRTPPEPVAFQGLRTLAHLLIGSVVAFPVSFLLRDLISPWFWNFSVFLGCLLLAFIALLVRALISLERGSGGTIESKMLGWFLAIIGFWAIIAFPGPAQKWQGALVFLVVVPLPITLLVADAFATFAIDWMTANPLITSSTMLRYRNAWRRRFTNPVPKEISPPGMSAEEAEHRTRFNQARQSYAFGLVGLGIGLSVVALCVNAVSPASRPYEKGIVFFVVLASILLLIACWRAWQWPHAFATFWEYFAAWFYFDQPSPVPPWVHRSPTFSIGLRRFLILVTVFVWGLALCYVTDHFSWFAFADPQPALRAGVIARAGRNDNDFIFLSLVVRHPFVAVWLLLAFVACLFLPLLLFLLILFVLTAPVIAAHHAALEASDAYEHA